MIFLANGGTLSELELRVLYVVTKIMMYDVMMVYQGPGYPDYDVL